MSRETIIQIRYRSPMLGTEALYAEFRGEYAELGALAAVLQFEANIRKSAMDERDKRAMIRSIDRITI